MEKSYEKKNIKNRFFSFEKLFRGIFTIREFKKDLRIVEAGKDIDPNKNSGFGFVIYPDIDLTVKNGGVTIFVDFERLYLND